MFQHSEQLPCYYCKHKQSYDESRAKHGEYTRCVECGKRITWNQPFVPPGPPRWVRSMIIDDRTGTVAGYEE